MTSLIHSTAHGLVAGDAIYFGNLVPTDCGLVEGDTYYVLAAGLTANDFAVSTTLAGAAFALTFDISEGTVSKIAVYTPITSPTDAMPPPVAPNPPGSVVLSSAVTVAPDGTAITRLDITIVQPTSATLRHTVVTVQGPSGQPVEVIIPIGKTTGSVASVIPGASYTASGIAYDTFGNASTATASSAHVAAGDFVAPATPTGHAVVGGILSAFISWTRNTEADLDHYIVFWSTSPVLAGFSSMRVYSTSVNIANLTAGTWYFNVAAVDHSDNQSGSTTIISATVRLTDVVSNAGATVTIDPSGLTVLNGALTLQDEFGKSVLAASGFSGDWTDFIRLGLYNSRFLTGAIGTVANGRSANLPYWTLSDNVGSPVATFLSGGGVKVTFAALSNKKRLISDRVPCRPSVDHTIPFTATATYVAGALMVMQATILWYKSDGTASATPSTTMTSASFGGSPGGTIPVTSFDLGAATAPTDAFYAQVQIDVSETLVHSASNFLTIMAIGFIEAPVRDLSNVGGIGSGHSRFVDQMEVKDSLTVDNKATLAGVFSMTNTITDTLSTNPANWAPTGCGTATLISVSPGGAARSIHSLDASARSAGDIIMIRNSATATAQTITLVYESASAASATDKFRLPNAADLIIRAQGQVMLMYSGARWVALAI